MEEYQQIINMSALALGIAWASGINLYATLLVLGLLGLNGSINLPVEIEILSSPVVIAAAGLLYLVEFSADKIPGVDNVWDAIHTLIRVPSGAVLAAAAVADVNLAVTLTAIILGASIALLSHATKAGSRILINTSPEPVSNWLASITEDILVVAGLWVALYQPALFLLALLLFLLMLIWILPRLWNAIRKILARIFNYFRGKENMAAEVVDVGQSTDKPIATMLKLAKK